MEVYYRASKSTTKNQWPMLILIKQNKLKAEMDLMTNSLLCSE